jgi:hypothetical protein
LSVEVFVSLSAQQIVEQFESTRELAQQLRHDTLSELIADATLMALSRYYEAKAGALHCDCEPD